MNWADDVDDDVTPDAPKIEERDEGNGVKVITEYRTNPDGKKIKVGGAEVGRLPNLRVSYHAFCADHPPYQTNSCYYQGQCCRSRA